MVRKSIDDSSDGFGGGKDARLAYCPDVPTPCAISSGAQLFCSPMRLVCPYLEPSGLLSPKVLRVLGFDAYEVLNLFLEVARLRQDRRF